MKLYTFPGSPVCRPIAMFVVDHGLNVEEQVVDLMTGEQYQPAFAAINPNNAVPVLEDGAFRLTESSAILKYLAHVADSPAYPKPLQALPGWQSADAALYGWAEFTRGRDHVRV
jgi:glutathione S-transferase